MVSGVRTPHSLEFLKNNYPEIYAELDGYQKLLETHHRDMQDLEITVEDRKLYMLQTRNGKRTAKASVRMAVDMVKEGLITEKEGASTNSHRWPPRSNRVDPQISSYHT